MSVTGGPDDVVKSVRVLEMRQVGFKALTDGEFPERVFLPLCMLAPTWKRRRQNEIVLNLDIGHVRSLSAFPVLPPPERWLGLLENVCLNGIDLLDQAPRGDMLCV